MKLTSTPLLKKRISANRENYFVKNNIDPKNVVSAKIIHGNKISIVSKAEGGKIIAGADGLIAQSKNIYLSVTSSDCLPIFLFEPEKEIIGMIHAGWKSLEKNILSGAIEKIRLLGGVPENILAGIGPAICQNHYAVGPEVAAKFQKYPEAVLEKGYKTFLDIKKVAEMQLLNLGLLENNIEISSECTFELPEKYFSARREKPKMVEAMIAVVGMKLA